MKFQELNIPGAWRIEFDGLVDDRGSFRRHFCEIEFQKRGIDSKVRQANLSKNTHKHTLRGLHYQCDPHWEAKTISCIKGKIYGVVVDLRPKSASYLKWVPTELDADVPISLHVPKGCAIGWITLQDSTILHYYMSEIYVPEAGAGIRYNDPRFGFIWPVKPAVISTKDQSFPDWKEPHL